MNKSLFERSIFLLSLVIKNSTMNWFPISNSTYVQISCVKYIPLLCPIWPQFIQKSSLFYQQKLGMIQTRVPNSKLCSFCRQSSIHSSANYIHCSGKLSVLISQFTVIHNSPQCTIDIQNIFPCVWLGLAVELSVFLWGSLIEWGLIGCQCNSVVVFTTNWKFRCCCIHCLFGVNEGQKLVYTHTFPFIPNWH